MPRFTDANNKSSVIVPDGDYIYCVTQMKAGLSTGARTNGCDKFDLELELEGHGSIVFEALIDHASTIWKMDTFLKSAGVKLTKDEPYDFRREQARNANCRYINPVGLRGWCRIAVEEYTSKTNEKKKRNKVVTFYTDRPKLTRLAGTEESPAPVDEENLPF